MKFSKNLQELRTSKNLSQEQLAEKIGVSRQSISSWESGKTLPEIDKVAEICKVFGVSSSELLGEISKNHSRKFDKKEYSARISKSAIWRAIGIFALFAGLSLTAFIFGSSIKNREIISGIALMISIAISAPILVFESNYNQLTFKKLKKSGAKIEDVFDENEIENFSQIKTISSVILIAAVFLALAFWQISQMAFGENAHNLSNAIFMMTLGIGISISTYGNAIFAKILNFDLIKYEERNRKIGIFWAILMLSTTAIFLIYSFVTKNWDSSASFFSFSGIVGAIATIIFENRKK